MCMIKKYALIAAAGFFLLGGCGNIVGNPDVSNSLSVDSAAETAGSAVEEEAVSWEYLGYEEGILQIKMTNNTDEDIMYGEDYELYQELGGRWEYVLLHTGFHLLAFYLEPQSSIPLEYEYKSIYKLSRGKYKFEKNYDTPDGETHVGELVFEIE